MNIFAYKLVKLCLVLAIAIVIEFKADKFGNVHFGMIQLMSVLFEKKYIKTN